MTHRFAAFLLASLLFAPALHAEEAPAPTAPSAPAATAPAATTPAPTTEAHLASYRHRADAERGWKVLTEAYSSVLYFHAAIREVDLPGKGKGHYFRLFADGDQEMMGSLCKSMHERKLYCVLMPIAAAHE